MPVLDELTATFPSTTVIPRKSLGAYSLETFHEPGGRYAVAVGWMRSDRDDHSAVDILVTWSVVWYDL